MDILSAYLEGIVHCYMATSNGYVWGTPRGKRKARWCYPRELVRP